MSALSSDMAYSPIFALLVKALPNLLPINRATSLGSKKSKLSIETSIAAWSTAGCETSKRG